MSLIHEIDYGTPAPKTDKMVTLTIDGMEITVAEGTSIMRAAMEMGTQIPKLARNLGRAQKEFKDGMDDGAKAAGSPTVVSPTSVTDTTATSSNDTSSPSNS